MKMFRHRCVILQVSLGRSTRGTRTWSLARSTAAAAYGVYTVFTSSSNTRQTTTMDVRIRVYERFGAHVHSTRI